MVQIQTVETFPYVHDDGMDDLLDLPIATPPPTVNDLFMKEVATEQLPKLGHTRKDILAEVRVRERCQLSAGLSIF